MRRSGRSFAFLAVALLGVALAAGAWFVALVRVDRSRPASEVRVIVPRGSTGRDVARLLAGDGVIGSALAYDVYARLRGEEGKMQAGEFRFAPHRTLAEVLRQLVTGGEQTAVWVTIPEGFTAREVAATLASRGFGDAARLEAGFKTTSLDLAGARTATLEGYLFPETYLVPVGASPAQIAGMMTAQFRAALPPDAAERSRKLGLTIAQVVTVASLVEREAKADDERAVMAGVYYNRLRRRMPLEVDATIEYTFAHHKDVITRADLRIDSPYNTYEHTGLPPTPIANPGRLSLQAAFHPAATDYLYYVAMGNGHSAFARTLAEHNANVARYLH